MKFSEGDHVILRRTGEEGTVVSIPKKGPMMEVAVGGVVIPVFADELDHPYLKWFLEERRRPKQPLVHGAELPAERAEARAPKMESGLHLQFVPQFQPQSGEDLITGFSIFLLYQLSDSATFGYEVRSNSGELLFSFQTLAAPFSQLLLHVQSLEELNNQPRITWSLLHAGSGKLIKQGLLRIRTAQLVRHVGQLMSGESPSFSYTLTNDLTPDPTTIEAGNGLASISQPLQRDGGFPLPQPRRVLDLHIEELTVHAKDMSATEMLELQMATLEYYLYLANAYNLPEMIIIHGIGAGKLKKRVADFLKSAGNVASYSQNWLPGYGAGATRVVFR